METADRVEKQTNEKIDKSSDELIRELTNSVALLPDFIIEPLKEYIKEEVTYRFAQEMDYLIEKKIEPYNKTSTIQRLIIMFLLLMLITVVLISKF
jgi:hypothetical protein